MSLEAHLFLALLEGTVGAMVLALTAVGLLIIASLPTGTPVAGLMAAGIVGLSTWMLISPRYGLTLAALMLYVGLLDGYLKLKTGSDHATIARDVLLYAIAAGAMIRATVGRCFGTISRSNRRRPIP